MYNQNQKSKDYSEIASYYRPGHADYTSTRNTVSAITAAADVPPGARRSDVLQPAQSLSNIKPARHHILTYTRSIGPISISSQNFDAAQINENPLYMPDADAAETQKII